MKKHGIIILIIVLILTLCACGKSKKVQEVDDLIAAIGEISLNRTAAVEAAENAVAELSKRQRNQLENREILESARSALSDLQYIESHYDVEQFPEVVATKQQGIDTSKEGIQLNSRELAMVTDNYKQLARGDDNDEDSHHNIRRERSYGIDEQGEDPELDIYQNE